MDVVEPCRTDTADKALCKHYRRYGPTGIEVVVVLNKNIIGAHRACCASVIRNGFNSSHFESNPDKTKRFIFIYYNLYSSLCYRFVDWVTGNWENIQMRNKNR